jgi:hypothetical protein
MFDNVADSCDMFHSGEVMHQYSNAAYSVGSGDEVVSEEVADEPADGECRNYVFHVSWGRVFDVRNCLARCCAFLKEVSFVEKRPSQGMEQQLTSKCQLDTKVSRTTSHRQRRKFSSVPIQRAIWNT